MLLHKLADSFANMIQMSPREVCLAEDSARELKTLCSIYRGRVGALVRYIMP
jgi:hypothetical protein